MEGVFTIVVMAVMISGLIFGFVNQLIYTLRLKSSKMVIHRYRRTLIGHYLTTAMFAGFLISFLLNVLAATVFTRSNWLTSDVTGFSCFLFLTLLLISRYVIVPKKQKLIT